MNNVKENLKTISKQTTKMVLIDLTLNRGREVLVNQATKLIPNPALKTAVQVAGYAGYFVLANHFTIEESKKVSDAITDMACGDKYEKELEKLLEERIELEREMKEISEQNEKEQDAE